MDRYPLFLNLSDRSVVVVGGGLTALRRGRAVVDAGAKLTVVAPEILPELAEFAHTVIQRSFDPADIQGAWLVHACTDDPDTNAAIAGFCHQNRIWCARADDAALSSAWVPAVAQGIEVTVAVSGGRDPRRAAAVRDAIATALLTGSLPERRVRPGVGHVALIGGGPGNPGLITLRGHQLLLAADVVVVDRLAPRELLASLSDDVEIVDAGKSSHSHNLTQDQINEVLVDRATKGLRVARLKGGDPFVFGRGGEEALVCARAGIEFEIVPGITSAISVPGLAGIPVTHRGIAQDVSIISAHLDPTAAGSTVDWVSLAKTQGTLVLLMAVERLSAITAALIEGGRPPSTPVAIITDGSTPQMRVVVDTLDMIAKRAVDEGVAPPAVVVIGDVVSLRDQILGTG